MATKGVILNSMPSQAESITGRYKYNPRDELVKLANKTRTVYPLFNVFELSSNRFARLENFIHLTRELIVFNEELTLRKDGGLEIRNLVITYSLYENMFDRLKVNRL